MVLSQEQVDFFHENGYLSYGVVLEAEEIEVLRREYDAELRRARETNSYRNLAISDGGDSASKEAADQQMLQLMQMCDRNIHFRRLIYNDRILDVLEDLLGPNIMLFHDQALYKPAHTGGPVFWHQDNAYWRCAPANLISCWLTLDDVDRDNGAMQLLPGSHLRPAHHDPSSSTNALLDSSAAVDETKAVVVELPAGGCMFHHCQTLHYTQPNATDRQRRAMALHYMAPGTRAGDGEIMHTGFSRPMVRMRM